MLDWHLSQMFYWCARTEMMPGWVCLQSSLYNSVTTNIPDFTEPVIRIRDVLVESEKADKPNVS